MVGPRRSDNSLRRIRKFGQEPVERCVLCEGCSALVRKDAAQLLEADFGGQRYVHMALCSSCKGKLMGERSLVLTARVRAVRVSLLEDRTRWKVRGDSLLWVKAAFELEREDCEWPC